MYIGNQKVSEIKGSTVVFADGTEKYLPKAEEYLITEEAVVEQEGVSVDTIMETKIQLFMLKKFIEVIQSLNGIASFVGTTAERDDNNVVVTTALMQLMVDYDFKISRVDKVFHALKSWMQGLNNLMMNNILGYERKSMVKAIGLEDEGDSDDERLNNVKLSHYMKFLNSN